MTYVFSDPVLDILTSGNYDPCVSFAPMSHATGLFYALVNLLCGNRVHLLTKFHLETFLRVLDDNKVHIC